jgi:CDGSH-type Zn-finger protein
MTAPDPPLETSAPSDPRTPPGTVTVRCRENGPLVVELPADAGLALRVTDHLGNAFGLPTGKRAVALCRCGQTATRPFCDGSHRTCGFSAADIAPPPP